MLRSHEAKDRFGVLVDVSFSTALDRAFLAALGRVAFLVLCRLFLHVYWPVSGQGYNNLQPCFILILLDTNSELFYQNRKYEILKIVPCEYNLMKCTGRVRYCVISSYLAGDLWMELLQTFCFDICCKHVGPSALQQLIVVFLRGQPRRSGEDQPVYADSAAARATPYATFCTASISSVSTACQTARFWSYSVARHAASSAVPSTCCWSYTVGCPPSQHQSQ